MSMEMLRAPRANGAGGESSLGLQKRAGVSPFARTFRIGLTVMAMLAFGAATAKATSCDYYASPTGTGNGLSATSPFRISSFWPVASAGKTLCLLDGTYTGDARSMILPPQRLNGASGLPITVRALNDGKVLINGQGGQLPVQLYYNDWFVIEGINACCSGGAVVALSHSNNNVVRRVAAWDAADKNATIFGAHLASYNLFEDVAGWGTARKIFAMSQGGDYTTVRRAWGRWERSTVVGPKHTYSLAYNSYHMTCENCLGTWSGQGMPETYVLKDYSGRPWTGNGAGTLYNHDVNQPYGIFSIDGESGDKNAYARLLGSLAYVLPADIYKPSFLVFMSNLASVEVKGTAAYIASGTNLSVRPFGLYGPSGATNLQASDVTSFGGKTSDILVPWNASNAWSASSPSAYAPGENIFNTTRGANLCYSYRDGNLTNQPLWPWPMNQRIKDALVQSGRSPVDITATIQGFFGSIPAACYAATPIPPKAPSLPTPMNTPSMDPPAPPPRVTQTPGPDPGPAAPPPSTSSRRPPILVVRTPSVVMRPLYAPNPE
jgi:hypothetical protein